MKDQVGQWEKEAGESPTLLAALAKRYTELKQFDEAERSLTPYIKLSPDYWGYHTLAENYKARNDLKRWQEILDEFLANGEDLGLDHAKVGVELAEHFMRQKLWDKAWPYAESAAESWAQWAMDCARRCALAMEKLDEAEQRTPSARPNVTPTIRLADMVSVLQAHRPRRRRWSVRLYQTVPGGDRGSA